MRNSYVFVAIVLGGLGAALAVCPSVAGAPDRAGPDFPDYTRQGIVEVCLSEYGMENSSTLDCLKQDEGFKADLSKRWTEVDGQIRSDCLSRLAKRRLDSYMHLDRCIKAAEKEKSAPSPD